MNQHVCSTQLTFFTFSLTFNHLMDDEAESLPSQLPLMITCLWWGSQSVIDTKSGIYTSEIPTNMFRHYGQGRVTVWMKPRGGEEKAAAASVTVHRSQSRLFGRGWLLLNQNVLMRRQVRVLRRAIERPRAMKSFCHHIHSVQEGKQP